MLIPSRASASNRSGAFSKSASVISAFARNATTGVRSVTWNRMCRAATSSPLASSRRKSVAERAVYIGNAAQTLHPVAGQGLNLGLRDAWDLAQLLRDAPDPGDAATLARFAARRRLDAGAAIRITDLLATAFLRANLPFNLFTGAALTALDVFPPARRFFARRMMFGPSALP